MIRIEDNCVGCTSIGLPCRGRYCPNRHQEVHYCDHCDKELTNHKIYEVDGEELCQSCAEEAEEND
jgi:hypothetical protein